MEIGEMADDLKRVVVWKNQVKALLPVGAAAAIAAAFNPPLAAVLFALEEVGIRCARGCRRNRFCSLHKATAWITRARFLKFPTKTLWFQPVAGGLLVGLLGWFVPQVLGVGYGYVGEALNG